MSAVACNYNYMEMSLILVLANYLIKNIYILKGCVAPLHAHGHEDPLEEEVNRVWLPCLAFQAMSQFTKLHYAIVSDCNAVYLIPTIIYKFTEPTVPKMNKCVKQKYNVIF